MPTDPATSSTLALRWHRLQRRRARRAPDLVAGFWFQALLVSLLGPLLAALTLVVDKTGGAGGFIPELVISPESARTILGSISGSLITIASLTSSLTIVTLQLLSNQYTPRTVRGFLSTRLSQVVLGGFIGIFLYCLILLVTVREQGEANSPFVPTLGVLLSVLLAVVGLVMLVVFIHAMSQAIQPSTMAARIAKETTRAIDVVHGGGEDPAGSHAGLDDRADTDRPRQGKVCEPVRASTAGYVRGVDVPTLQEELDTTSIDFIEVRCKPGDFVTPATVIAFVHSGLPLGQELTRTLSEAVIVEREREIGLDPGYGLRQLSDIALRALSPGINDPSTAVTCMGYLRAQLEQLASLELPDLQTVRCGQTLLVLDGTTFSDYLELLNEVAPYAGTDARVVASLLACYDSISGCARDDARRDYILEVREQVRGGALAEARLDRDRDRLSGPPTLRPRSTPMI